MPILIYYKSKTFKIMKNNFKKRIYSLVLMFLAGYCQAVAQNKNVGDAFGAANDQLKNTVDGALTTFQYVCGLGALVGGCMLFYKFVNGEQDASKKTGQWVGGLVVFVVVLQMVKVFFFAK